MRLMSVMDEVQILAGQPIIGEFSGFTWNCMGHRDRAKDCWTGLRSH